MKWVLITIGIFLSFLLLSITVYAFDIGHTGRTKILFMYYVDCSAFPNQTSCEEIGCYWWDDTCHNNLAIYTVETSIICVNVDNEITVCKEGNRVCVDIGEGLTVCREVSYESA